MSRRILVVEDDAQNSYLIGFILERAGYDVVTAADGQQAVDMVESELPDLVLMDMLLPKMNGYEATRRIKSMPSMGAVPIIALTAYSMKGDREKILEAGCDGYISKPIDPETFVAEMEAHLAGFLTPMTAGGESMRVLVVDDEEPGRYLVTALLEGHGHDVVEATDGVEALRLARAQVGGYFDIVVTDILMPNMDGYALCRAWKTDPELKETPLVFYTASYTDPADERFAGNLGADAFLIKPLDPDDLLARIERVVEEHATRRTATGVPEPLGESEVLRQYNERLVAKLEEKVVELNKANNDLTQALMLLSDEVEVKKTLIEQLTQDMGVRELAQTELQTIAEMLQAIVASSSLAIIAVDREWRVTVWNAASERLLGWTADEVVGRPYPPFAEDPASAEAAYGALMRGEVDSVHEQVSRRGKDGRTKEIDVHASPLHDADGAVSGLVSMAADVTEARHIEMVKGAFLSMVSHELRTPLTSIIGYSDLLEQIDVRERPEMFHQLLSKIRDRGDSMRRLIDNLLDAMQIQSAPVRLIITATDIVGMVQAEAERAELTPLHSVEVRAEPNLPLVPMDRERIAKVVRQLVANAVKYSPDGGVIGIHISRDDGHVLLAVSDPGIGIEPSDMEHIFDRFTQADMTDTRSFGGIGVGLFLARQAVEAHRGSLTAASVPGEGATFTVSLPVLP